MKIAISAETTIDLTKELIEEFDIKIVPFSIQLGEKSVFDGEITTDDIISFVNETGELAKTSAVNEYAYTEHFSKILENYDAIVHFSLSSKMSLACTNAINAAKQFKNVFVVDTLSLSTGIALLALYAKRLADNGDDAQTIYEKCIKRVPSVQASFELKRLDYLHKGGRCSSLTYFGANLLKIRPQIVVKDGKMVTGKKYRGNFNHIVKNYCRDVLEEYNTPDLTEAFLTYTTADEEVLETAKNALVERGFKRIHVTRAGGTITSHCGEDCLGILYINDGNNK
ncbi:MAG: DegV family protein [Clostridia bacterium]|nr:DegV family protein [Clostridia bacterium]